MSFDQALSFQRRDLDLYLKELAKEYRRLAGRKMPAEIVLIGGAAIVNGYGFRNTTTDIDALIHAASSMKDAIIHVGDRFSLPPGWLNSDFTRTNSYTDRIVRFSRFYKSFYQVLSVRILTGEYLIAMKLRSFRHYKNDISDIVGILAEHTDRREPISFAMIDRAVRDLYDSWDDFPAGARPFLDDIFRNGEFSALYEKVRENERAARTDLLTLQDSYSDLFQTADPETVLRTLRAKKVTKSVKK